MTNFSLDRKITSYGKVRKWIANTVRNKKGFIKSGVNEKEFLDIGCGPNTSKEFVNLDYHWSPEIDVCWDFTKKPLPFPDNHFKGVFSEHCFEHIGFQQFEPVMRDIYRIMKPGAAFRLIMPDGQIYLDIYQERKTGTGPQMPFEQGYISPMHRINGIFRNHGHLFIYDFDTVKIILEKIGFKNIKKEKFMSGRMPELLRDTEWRAIESLYVESEK